MTGCLCASLWVMISYHTSPLWRSGRAPSTASLDCTRTWYLKHTWVTSNPPCWYGYLVGEYQVVLYVWCAHGITSALYATARLCSGLPHSQWESQFGQSAAHPQRWECICIPNPWYPSVRRQMYLCCSGRGKLLFYEFPPCPRAWSSGGWDLPEKTTKWRQL